MEKIELIDLWFLDGNYNEPVKTKRFEASVKNYHYESVQQGYIYICPESGAFMIGNYHNLFYIEKFALEQLSRQKESHKAYLQRQLQKYTEELKKFQQ